MFHEVIDAKQKNGPRIKSQELDLESARKRQKSQSDMIGLIPKTNSQSKRNLVDVSKTDNKIPSGSHFDKNIPKEGNHSSHSDKNIPKEGNKSLSIYQQTNPPTSS